MVKKIREKARIPTRQYISGRGAFRATTVKTKGSYGMRRWSPPIVRCSRSFRRVMCAPTVSLNTRAASELFGTRSAARCGRRESRAAAAGRCRDEHALACGVCVCSEQCALRGDTGTGHGRVLNGAAARRRATGTRRARMARNPHPDMP